MFSKSLKRNFQKRLAPAGITINGPHPFDPQIHNLDTLKAVVDRANLGFGEAYMEGWWECSQLDEFFNKILRARLHEEFKISPALLLIAVASRLTNPQRRSKAFEVGKRHYDLNNDFFAAMLGPTMAYSCGYWEKGARSLDEAQIAKFALIGQKLDLKPGQRVLDIGCGWGSLDNYLASRYGVEVVGLTVSKEQQKFAKAAGEGLSVKFLRKDYRDLSTTEKFDRIVSVGMFEHVGYKNYDEFMRIAAQALIGDGLFLLHSIVSPKTEFLTDPFLEKYIFPNGFVPSLAQITKAAEKYFVVEDVHDIGANYDPTLMAWYHNFVKNWPSFKSSFPESDKFYRMWEYYLLCCAGSFRARKSLVDQIIFSKYGVPGGYISKR